MFYHRHHHCHHVSVIVIVIIIVVVVVAAIIIRDFRGFKIQRRNGNENALKKLIRVLSFFIAIIPTHLLCQM